jgi:hypothetical protein
MSGEVTWREGVERREERERRERRGRTARVEAVGFGLDHLDGVHQRLELVEMDADPVYESTLTRSLSERHEFKDSADASMQRPMCTTSNLTSLLPTCVVAVRWDKPNSTTGLPPATGASRGQKVTSHQLPLAGKHAHTGKFCFVHTLVGVFLQISSCQFFSQANTRFKLLTTAAAHPRLAAQCHTLPSLTRCLLRCRSCSTQQHAAIVATHACNQVAGR